MKSKRPGVGMSNVGKPESSSFESDLNPFPMSAPGGFQLFPLHLSRWGMKKFDALSAWVGTRE